MQDSPPMQDFFFNKENVPRDSYDPCGKTVLFFFIGSKKLYKHTINQTQRIDQRTLMDHSHM